MYAFDKKYLNADSKVFTEITNRTYYLVKQAALDKKMFFRSEDEMIDLGNDNEKALHYYNGMLAISENSGKIYIWTESEEGLIEGGYKYPKHYNSVYADKTFNFVELSNYLFPYFDIDILKETFTVPIKTFSIYVGENKNIFSVTLNGLEQSNSDYSYDSNSGNILFNFELYQGDIITIKYYEQ